MITKKFLLFIMSIIFFAVSIITLICAMALHAILDDSVMAPAIIGGISFVFSFIAVITVCFYSKEKGEKQ